jgi:hypothetical protein
MPKKITTEQFVEKSKKIHGDKYDYSVVIYEKSNKYITIYNKKCKKTFGELYYETLIKFNKLKNLGYNVKYIWELDWKRFKSGLVSIPKILEY